MRKKDRQSRCDRLGPNFRTRLFAELFKQGFAPAWRVTFVSAKVTKTISARLRPSREWRKTAPFSSRSLRLHPEYNGERTRCDQTALAEKSIRASDSAAAEGGNYLRSTSRKGRIPFSETSLLVAEGSHVAKPKGDPPLVGQFAFESFWARPHQRNLNLIPSTDKYLWLAPQHHADTWVR